MSQKVAASLAARMSFVGLVVRMPSRTATWVRFPYLIRNRFLCVCGRAAEALVFQTGLGGFDSHHTLVDFQIGSLF